MNTTQATTAQSTTPTKPIELEEDLSILLDEQAARLTKRRKRANWVIFAFFGLMMGSASAWHSSSEANQRKVADLILNIKSSGKHFKMITSVDKMASQYDKALEKIGSRSENINDAAVAMGIDPTTVEEDGLESEMKEIMGEDGGATVGKRNKLLQQKLGKFVKKPDTPEPVTTRENPAPPAKAAASRAPAASPAPAAAVHPKPTSTPVVIPEEEDAPLIIR